MKEHITKWLNGSRNYSVGIVLYKQFGRDESLNKLFAAGRNEYAEKMLAEKLAVLLEVKEEPAAAPAVSAFETMPDDDDSVLQAIKNNWMPLYTEMNYKRHALDVLLEEETDEAVYKRAQLAKSILQLEKQCIKAWQQRDYYLKHRSLPGTSTKVEIVVDPFQAAKRIENLKIYIRRYKATVTRKPGDARAAELLKQYQDELTQLQQANG